MAHAQIPVSASLIQKKEEFTPDDLNKRGKWLFGEKDKQKAKEIKADWLKNSTGAK